ncbi:MAG: efflux RND transporter periplasmic adaptor subunit [bacterium]
MNAHKNKIIMVLVALIAFSLGMFLSGGSGESGEAGHEHGAAPGTKAETWTCSMHPQIKLPKPGKCPICFMDLILLKKGSEEDEGERKLSMSHASRKLAEIETAPVERKEVTAEVRMVGKVDYDESRVKAITSRIPGRLDRLYVDYTGIPVKKGHHLISIYSPELYAAQEELIQAIQAVKNLSSSKTGTVKQTAGATIEAAREKLRQWGVTRAQISRIESKGKAEDHLTIYAPMQGVVIHKNAVEGMYVNTGTRLYTIADLSRVWVKLDAYESDLAWLRYGQEVEFTAQALPGEVFKGRIGFIDPVLNPATRTVKVRVNVDNKDRRLKPDLFMTGIVSVKISSHGAVIDDFLVDKWICPMHPEVVSGRSGSCNICGMPLVPAKTLGFAGSQKTGKAPLVIPASAPLITGKRAVVYVDVTEADKPAFEGREVVLGPRAGDYYIIKSGLAEGDLVVTHGAFKIDAEMQIQAKPSMMSPEGSASSASHENDQSSPKSSLKQTAPDEFIKNLEGLYGAYFNAHKTLAGDDYKKAQAELMKVKEAANAIDMKKLNGQTHDSWMSILKTLNQNLEHVMHLGDISAVRKVFGVVSSTIIDLEKNFGHAGREKRFVAFCPMAFNNKGGSWLQTEKIISNPFYGSAMLRCGEVKEELAGK